MSDATAHDASQAAFDALLRCFDRSLRALGDAGEGDLASRIAAEAWSAVRHEQPRAARRINATMHYLLLPPRSGRRQAGSAHSSTPAPQGAHP